MKMKKLLFAVLALAGFAVSCDKTEDETPAVKLVSPAVVNVPKEGGNVTVTFTSATDWQLRDIDKYDWIAADINSGKGSADQQSISLAITPNTDKDRTASLVIYSSPLAKKTVTLTQPGDKGDGVVATTVADFLAAKDTETSSVLTGKIGDIAKSTSYYGFTLKDETGTVSVPFPSNWDDFKANLHTGDQITVTGPYSYYESKSQDQVKNGTLSSHVPAAAADIQKVTVKEFLDKADGFTRYRLEGTVTGTVNATYASFTLKDDTGEVLVYTVNNASEWGSKLSLNGKVTLIGAYTVYSDKSEVVDADIESFEAGEDPGTGGGDPETPGEGEIYVSSFASGLGDWTIENVTIPSALKAVWQHNASYKCMIASGYDDANSASLATDSYLISPEIDLTAETAAYLEFDQAVNKFNSIEAAKTQAVVNVRVGTGAWTPLVITNYPTSLSWNFLNTGSIDLKDYVGKKIQIAFHYTSSTAGSGSWEVQNVKITKAAQKAPEQDPTFTADKTIIIDAVKTSFAAATDADYGAGFAATIDGTSIGYYKAKGPSAAVAPTDIIKFYKDHVMVISDSKTIKAVRFKCSSKTYTVAVTAVDPKGLTSEIDTSALTIKISGAEATSYKFSASAQIRIEKIEIDYAE